MNPLELHLHLLSQHRPANTRHIINVSGGKDSTAVYLMALESGRPFRPVFADTGHEHPLTYEYVRTLAKRTGGPKVEVVRRDFTRELMVRRDFTRELMVRRENIASRWPDQGVSQERVDRIVSLMHPTGIPFLDLCLWKGRFPSTRVRFCTEELKHAPIDDQIVRPALRKLNYIFRWQGERRDESPSRSGVQTFQRVVTPDGTIVIYRPIAHWTAQDVFDFHDRHGVRPNPLYRMGMGRVGCMPCIMARKNELRHIALRFPDEVARLVEWEKLVSEVAKRGESTFFSADKTPKGRNMVDGGHESGFPTVDYVLNDWSLTNRKGESDVDIDEGVMCSSQYGLCE